MRIAFLESQQNINTLPKATAVEIKSIHNSSEQNMNYLNAKIPSSVNQSITDNSL